MSSSMIPVRLLCFTLLLIIFLPSSLSIPVSAQINNKSSTISFSTSLDSSSVRLVSRFEYVGVLIYKTASYFNVDNFKKQVIESLPELIRLNPASRLDLTRWRKLPITCSRREGWEREVIRIKIVERAEKLNTERETEKEENKKQTHLKLVSWWNNKLLIRTFWKIIASKSLRQT